MVAMADQAEMRLLHMYTTGDPVRNPVFGFFADPDYFLTDFPANTCLTCINPAFAWNHGDIQPDIATTWLGFVGPGVRHLGRADDIWTDHTDVRPTMLTLLDLHDTYATDGRAIAELIRADAGPSTLTHNRSTLVALGAAYKQLDAPFGILSKASLRFATEAIVSGSAADDFALHRGRRPDRRLDDPPRRAGGEDRGAHRGGGQWQAQRQRVPGRGAHRRRVAAHRRGQRRDRLAARWTRTANRSGGRHPPPSGHVRARSGAPPRTAGSIGR